jgi:hypothetical protein
MKKYFWQLTSMVLAVMLLYSFNRSGNGNQNPCEEVCIRRDPANQFKGINPQLAFDMLGGYRSRRYNNIRIRDAYSGRLTRRDSRSVWFSLEKLKQFIYEIETNTCQSNCKTKKLGVRIYFSVYPNVDSANWKTAYGGHLGGDYGKLPKEYTNMQTLLMVPTISQNGLNTDFDYRYFDKQSCTAAAIDTVFEASVNSGQNMRFLGPTGEDDGSTNLNHGNLAPPPYDNESGGSRLYRTVTRPCYGTRFMNYIDGMPCGVPVPYSVWQTRQQ